MCFPFPQEKRQYVNQSNPHPFLEQSLKVVYVYWFFSPSKKIVKSGKKKTQPPPKDNLLGNFSGGLWPRKTIRGPVVDTKNPVRIRETISTTKISPLWPPFLSERKSSSLDQGGVCTAELEGTNGFLRKSVVSCGFLRKSAVSCGFLRKSAPPKCFNS